MLSNLVIQICTVASLNNFPCSEALAVAQVESAFNPKAVGSLGELGLFQVRPEYHGPVSKVIPKQINQAVLIMKRAKSMCYESLQHDWFVCFNRGIRGGLKRGRGTVYAARATKLAKKWEYILDANKSYLSLTRLQRSFSAEEILKTKTLVQTY